MQATTTTEYNKNVCVHRNAPSILVLYFFFRRMLLNEPARSHSNRVPATVHIDHSRTHQNHRHRQHHAKNKFELNIELRRWWQTRSYTARRNPRR